VGLDMLKPLGGSIELLSVLNFKITHYHALHHFLLLFFSDTVI
jgi:hypothetical protein